mmetsp:Transcript_30134/g.38881  ORF Transcript_30134/g.38881 Transcript_30134/m.38881 type:complete len:232 (+) Transcript_30134:149-844(+)
MIPKSIFKDFSLNHNDDNYFLRPDRILGCFYVDNSANYRKRRSSSSDVGKNNKKEKNHHNNCSLSEITVEVNRELHSHEKLNQVEQRNHNNITRIDKVLATIWNNEGEEEEEKGQHIEIESSVEISLDDASIITSNIVMNDPREKKKEKEEEVSEDYGSLITFQSYNELLDKDIRINPEFEIWIKNNTFVFWNEILSSQEKQCEEVEQVDTTVMLFIELVIGIWILVDVIL